MLTLTMILNHIAIIIPIFLIRRLNYFTAYIIISFLAQIVITIAYYTHTIHLFFIGMHIWTLVEFVVLAFIIISLERVIRKTIILFSVIAFLVILLIEVQTYIYQYDSIAILIECTCLGILFIRGGFLITKRNLRYVTNYKYDSRYWFIFGTLFYVVLDLIPMTLANILQGTWYPSFLNSIALLIQNTFYIKGLLCKN